VAAGRQKILGAVICLLVVSGLLFWLVWRSGYKIRRSKLNSPSPSAQTGPLDVQEFDPGDSCVSVEGGFVPPASAGGSPHEIPDGFAGCAQSLFSIQSGTQSSAESGDRLKTCLARSRKKALLIGHGVPGQIWTGNGDHRPRKGQSVSAGDPKALCEFRNLNTTELTLFGCWVGAGKEGAALVNNLRTAANATVKAQNGIVFCNDTREHRGLYVVKARTWIWADQDHDAQQVAQVVPDTKRFSCLRLKSGKGYLEVSLDLVSLISLDPLPGELWKHKKLPDSLRQQIKQLLIKKTRNLINQIDFCGPAEPGIPDLTQTGEFDLDVDRHVHHFNILGDTIVQDSSHPESLYWLDPNGFLNFKSDLQLELDQLLSQL
jgi:hypothetical protein